MSHRRLISVGAVGTGIAAVCCATPLLVVALPLIGLGAWLAYADLVLIPMLLMSVGILMLGLWRRQRARSAACGAASPARSASSR